MSEERDLEVVVSDDGRRLRPVKSLLRALELLDTLSRCGRPVGVSELAAMTGFSRSAAYNVVTTFELQGLVRRDAENRYLPGWALYEMGELARSGSDLAAAARPVVVDLAEATGETALVGVLDQSTVIYIEKAESRRSVRMVEAPGQRSPLHRSATGRVLLAHAAETFRHRYAASAELPESPSSLERLVAEIVTQGFALSVQDLDPDLTSASVPIFGLDGAVVAALTVAGPASRLTRERIEEFLPEILAAASTISKAVGGREPS